MPKLIEQLKPQHGHWTVRNEPPTRRHNQGQYYIPVTCTCGKTSEVRLDKLVYGLSTSCKPCKQQRLKNQMTGTHWPQPNLRNDPEITPGSQHNYWTTLTTPYNPPGTDRNAIAEFQCRCGTIKTRRTATVLTGESKSCGCYRQQAAKKITRN